MQTTFVLKALTVAAFAAATSQVLAEPIHVDQKEVAAENGKSYIVGPMVDSKGYLINRDGNVSVKDISFDITKDNHSFYVKNNGSTFSAETVTVDSSKFEPIDLGKINNLEKLKNVNLVTFEYQAKTDKEPDPQHKSYEIGTLNIGTNAAVRFVVNTNYPDLVENIQDKNLDLKIGTLNLEDHSLLGINLDSPRLKTKGLEFEGLPEARINVAEIKTINAFNSAVRGGVDDTQTAKVAWIVTPNTQNYIGENGKFSTHKEAKESSTIAVDTINIGDGVLVFGTKYAIQSSEDTQIPGVVICPNGEKLEGILEKYVGGPALKGLTTDTITINLTSANSGIVLGDIGEPQVNPNPSGKLQASNVQTDSGINTHLVFHFSEEALGNDSDPVQFTSQLTKDVSIGIEADLSNSTQKPNEVANSALGKVFSKKNSANLEAQTNQNTTVTVNGDVEDFIYSVTAGQDGTLPTIDDKVNPVVKVDETVKSLFEYTALGSLQWRSELNHMQSRLGEIRDQGEKSNGLWVRTYGGKDKFGENELENSYYALQLGYDYTIGQSGWTVGVAFDYNDGETKFYNGEGDNDAYTFTAYGTFIAQNGLFLDFTGKYGKLNSTATFAGGSTDVDADAFAVTAEAGWRIPLASQFYIEPQVELQWGRVEGDDYQFANQFAVKQDAMDMLIARAGVQAGFKFAENKGSAYARASVLHDFDSEYSMTFTGLKTKRVHSEVGDFESTWGEFAVGGSYHFTDSTSGYAEFQYSKGSDLESPYHWNVGFRYMF